MPNTSAKIYHVLNGDSLLTQFNETSIEGTFIICRECLIDGSLEGTTLPQFWNNRSKFISETYKVSEKDYFHTAVSELEKLLTLPENSEVCLWFENDLFCQTNMWFVISLLASQSTLKVYRVFPIQRDSTEQWKGFGISSKDMLEKAYQTKVAFSNKDIKLGNSLWGAYKNQNLTLLTGLSQTKSDCFQYLEEVCQAHADRFPSDKSLGRPERILQEIIETKSKDFQDVFLEFTRREGIYGFGDIQIKTLYDKQVS